jgi:Tol biopolymer transport system component
VFQSDVGGQLDLWTMRPDGSGAAKLTNDKGRRHLCRVVAERQEGRLDSVRVRAREIWTMSADGTGQRQVTHNSYSDDDAVWSPDSSQLAFRSVRNGNRDIYVINADGTNERRLTTDPGADFVPDWAPDGSRIAFTSDRGATAIYTMLPDGSDVRQLTPDYLNAGAARHSAGRHAADLLRRLLQHVR